MQYALKVKDVLYQFESFKMVADFNLEFGQRAALVGPSGMGKTTLLKILAGLIEIQRGEVYLGSTDILKLPINKRRVGFVFQDLALFSSLNVYENIVFGLKLQKRSSEQIQKTVGPWMERLGLTQKAKQSVKTLSGGEKQRVAFLRTLIWKPDLILLDEPFSALDQKLRSQLRQDLIEMHREHPVPLIFVTHDAEDVKEVSTQTLTLSEKNGIRIVT